MFTLRDWDEADRAVTRAEELADTGGEHQAGAALERAYLCYLSNLFDVEGECARQAKAAEHADNAALEPDSARRALNDMRVFTAAMRDTAGNLKRAHQALDLADSLLAPDSPHRALLELRRGLIAGNLERDTAAAATAYRAAHERALVSQDALVLADTSRQLGGLAVQADDRYTARPLLERSLELRVSSGFAVGVAPALFALAGVCPDDEAARLRAEGDRLVDVFGGLPAWLRARG
jgi:hypothetical protein